MKPLPFLVSTVLLASAAYAETAPPSVSRPPSVAAVSPKTVSLDAASMDVREALRSLASQSGARILAGPDVTGVLTTRLVDVPVETALSTIASVTKARWSCVCLPREKADALTAEKAALLVAAAETLLEAGAAVTSPGKPTVAANSVPNAGTMVYLVQAKSSRTQLALSGPNVNPRAETGREPEHLRMVGLMLSEDAQKDPNVVRAYSEIYQMAPVQVATLAREYLMHSTPEQREAVVKAFGEQQEKWANLPGVQ